MKLIRFCLLLLLLLCFLPAALPVSAAGQGDTDGDGTVSIQDVNILLQYVSSGKPVPDEDAFDVNGDGIISIKDVTGALQIICGFEIRREPRLTVTPSDGGLEIHAVRLPKDVTLTSVLVLGGSDISEWQTDPGSVLGVAQMNVTGGEGSVSIPLSDPTVPCTVVVSYAGGQLVREVN